MLRLRRYPFRAGPAKGNRLMAWGATENAPPGESRVSTMVRRKKDSPSIRSPRQRFCYFLRDKVRLPHRVPGRVPMATNPETWESVAGPVFYDPDAPLPRHKRPIGPQLPIYIRYPYRTAAAGCGEPRPPYPGMRPTRNEENKLMGWVSPWPTWMSWAEFVAEIAEAMKPDWTHRPWQPFRWEVHRGIQLRVMPAEQSAD